MKRHHRRGAISARQLHKALLAAGFTLTRFHGSHAIFTHTSGRAVVVPAGGIPGRDIKTSMLARIAGNVLTITGRELQL